MPLELCNPATGAVWARREDPELDRRYEVVDFSLERREGGDRRSGRSYFFCDCCGDRVWPEHLHADALCDDCQNAEQCLNCNRWERGGTDGDGYCDRCAEEDNSRNNGIVQPYHGSSRVWRVRRLPQESPNAVAVGVELETSAPDGDGESIAEEYLSELVDNGLAYLEEDSSISRDPIEIIYQPMTLRYIVANWHGVFGPPIRAYAAGLRSTSDYGCGMHVSTQARLWTRGGIYRLLTLLYGYAGFTAYLSRRRTESGLQRYALPALASYDTSRKRIANDKRHEAHGFAVNIESRRVEIRIFRGSLRPGLIMYNLQTTMALFAFCNDATTPREPVPADFIRYVKRYRKEYSHVWSHLQKVENTPELSDVISHFHGGQSYMDGITEGIGWGKDSRENLPLDYQIQGYTPAISRTKTNLRRTAICV